jgi:FdhD protein
LIKDISAFVISAEAQGLPPVAGAPRLSAAGAQLLREIEVLDETGARRSLQVPVERPLKIIVNERELVTLMTLGAKPELLVLGYLRNQRIVESVSDIESVDVDFAAGSAMVAARGAVAAALGVHEFAAAACGLGTVFGDSMMPTGAAAAARAGTARVSATRISHATLLSILEVTRQYDAVHRTAGSVHGCALFRSADLLVSVEDVSRHNGLDTVTGWMMLHGIAGGDKTLFTTGRLTGEMVMKAAHNGVSIMVSRNGVTSMGCEVAANLGMVLFGRAAKGRYVCYVGSERVDSGV